MQKFSKTLAIMGLMTPLSANALGTGEIILHSALNQRLNAEIALIVAADESLEDLRVSLAPQEIYAKAGIDRPLFLSSLRFEVLPKSKSRTMPAVRVTSADTISEPFINFLVELQWSQGHIMREFTLLLDPPSTFKERAIAARNAPSAESVATTTAAGVHASPDSYSGTEYGPVRSGETLWSIAKVVNQDRNVSVEQMVVALYEANPQAFGKSNIFAFLPGAKLRVPGKETALGRTQHDAKKIIKEHYTVWRSKAVDKSVAATPAKAGSATSGQPASASANDKALTLLAPPGQTRGRGARGKTPAASASKAELALEMADTVKQEIEDLRARLADRERQVQLAQRLLTLKDEQIAAIQAGKPMPPLPADLGMPDLALPTASTPKAAPGKPVEPVPAAPSAVTPMPAAEPVKPPVVEPIKPPVVETKAPVVEPPPVAEVKPPVAPPVKPLAVEPTKPEPIAPQPASATPPIAPQTPATLPPPAAEPQTTAVTESPAPAVSAPPKPKPPTPAPQPKAAPKGFFDELLGNTFMVGMLGGLALLVGALALLAVKRRRAALAEFDQDMSAQEIRPINVTQVAAESPSQEAGSGGGATGLTRSSQQGSFLSDYTPSDFDVLDSDNDAIDPISEADVYLAYARYSQAEELIRQAINENPFRDECKLKLLEIFYTAQNREAFEKYAAELLEENKNSDHDFWARVVDMGSNLVPDNPIFGGAKKEAPSVSVESAAPESAPEPASVKTVAAALDNVEFSFDMDEDDLSVVSPPPSAPAVSEAAEPALVVTSADEEGLSFDLGGFDELEPVASAVEEHFAAPVEAPELSFAIDTLSEPEPAPAPAAAQEESPGLDFNVDADATMIAASPKPPEVVIEEDDHGLSFDLGSFQTEPEAPVVETAAAPEKDESGLEFDAASLGEGGFSFAGVTQTADEPIAPLAEEEGRSLEFDASLMETAVVEPVAVEPEAVEVNTDFDLSAFAVPESPLTDTAAAAKDDEFNFDMNFDLTGQALDEEPVLDLTSAGELETKLDLARAYLDMDNADAAKLMLEEVVQQGDERQKLEAQALLDALVKGV